MFSVVSFTQSMDILLIIEVKNSGVSAGIEVRELILGRDGAHHLRGFIIGLLLLVADLLLVVLIEISDFILLHAGDFLLHGLKQLQLFLLLLSLKQVVLLLALLLHALLEDLLDDFLALGHVIGDALGLL